MDGGGLVISQQRVFTAWRRDGTVYMAVPGSRETALGQGKDVAMAAGPKGVYVAWDSAAGIELRPPDATPVKLSNPGGFPAITALPDGSIVAAWEEKDGITTKRLD